MYRNYMQSSGFQGLPALFVFKMKKNFGTTAKARLIADVTGCGQEAAKSGRIANIFIVIEEIIS